MMINMIVMMMIMLVINDYGVHDLDTVVAYCDDDILQGEAVSEKLTQRWEGGNKP